MVKAVQKDIFYHFGNQKLKLEPHRSLALLAANRQIQHFWTGSQAHVRTIAVTLEAFPAALREVSWQDRLKVNSQSRISASLWLSLSSIIQTSETLVQQRFARDFIRSSTLYAVL